MPDLTGKIVVVTGANSGLGYEVTRSLVHKGACVVLACRDITKGQIAAERIHRERTDGSMEVMKLDLASLASIRAFAEAFSQRYQALHIICNNAGVMATPYRHTVDGFELQIGTNHLGHFALTGLLSEIILATGEARVVTVTSSVHHLGRLKFDSFKNSRPYSRWAAYLQSKLANLFFAYELQRRFETGGSQAISVAVNPGYAATNLRSGGPRMGGSTLESRIIGLGNRIIAMSAEMGALGILYAAISSEIHGGEYINPNGFLGLRGIPSRSRSSRRSHDPDLASRLWSYSAELTSVNFEALRVDQPDTQIGTYLDA